MSQQPPLGQQQYPLGPPPGYQAAPSHRPRQAGLATTIVVTVFFGLFGAIAAAIYSDRATQDGVSGARYWKAFALTFGLVYVLIPGIGLILFWGTVMGALNGSTMANPSQARPGTSQSSAAPADFATPNQRTAAGPRPTQTNAPRYADPGGPAQQPNAPTRQQNPSLANGSWVTVLDSLDKSEYTWSQAASQASSLSNGSYTVQVIDTDPVPGLNSGYYALAVTGRGSRSDATSVCSSFGRSVGGACYPRQIG